MVAKAIGRPPAPPRSASDEDAALESGTRDKVIEQLQPLLERLKNRWVILVLFLIPYALFGYFYWIDNGQLTDLRGKIAEQERSRDVTEDDAAELEHQRLLGFGDDVDRRQRNGAEDDNDRDEESGATHQFDPPLVAGAAPGWVRLNSLRGR